MTVLAAACLSFVHAAGSSLALPPPNVQELLKTRVAHQWRQRASGPEATLLRFDDPSCAEKGSYHYTDRSLVLSADVTSWRGPLELPLVGILEGERLPFERVSGGAIALAPVPRKDASERATWKRWLPWTLAIAGGLTAGYLWIERERHVRQLQGLSLNF